MNIEYLKKLEKNKTIGSETIRGVTLDTIEKVEKKYAIKFPKSYKEYLYLAGEYSGNLPMLDTDNLEDISADWHMEIMKEEMEDTGTKIDRPFWLIAESNGCEIFYFFYLDEDTDDPEVYLVNYGVADRTRQIGSLGCKFTGFIDEQIRLAFRYEKEGY
jgi:hypothetical protein